MPYIVTGDPGQRDSIYTKDNYDYEYPEGLDLKPGSDLHKSLKNKIWMRAQASRTVMSRRYGSWNSIDKILNTYIPTSLVEKNVKTADPRKPISIVFPYTYSMLEALLTYMSMAFFQDPMFQYEGVEADDTVGAMLMELVVRLHCFKTKVPLAIHTALRDNFAYGLGVGLPGWKKIYGKKPVRGTAYTESELGSQTQNHVSYVESLLFEGNDLSNIDPYMWLPDTSVASSNIQDGEYIGWIDRDNYMNLLSDEASSDGIIFNVKYLRNKTDKRSSLSIDQSLRQVKYGGDTRQTAGTVTTPVDTIKMYVNLIPKEWKLGDSEYPEKWFFALSSDDIITSCHRAQHNHGMYPIAVASSEFDGYSTTPMSRLEILYGLQGVLDFLFNSHIANVRKSINDMLVVDPYLVNINDLKDPEPGKLIRLRRPAWGHGVDKVVQQLVVQDITRANIADSAYITQWMDRISGADQSMQGTIRQGGPERLTKGEFQGTRGSAISRLQRLAMIVGMQFMQDIGTMFAVHTQQYMSKDTYVKVVGRHSEKLSATFGKQSVMVSPYDIAINYDVIVRDGSIPGGNFSEAWIQMFSTIASTPELYQQFDIFRIFTYIAQQLGAKNIEDFKRVTANTQVQTMPDDKVLNEVDKGNLIPFGA